MSHLPIVHMTLYKHGVGYFQRRGSISGESITLTFRREEMDDLLKSLTVIDHGGGRVHGVDYDTPQSQAERLAGCSVILDDTRSLRDLLMALRGRTVQVLVSDGSNATGTLLGLDEDEEKPLERSLVSLLKKDSQTVAVLPLSRIDGLELRDDTAAADLRFFLKTALGQETHRSITIRFSSGDHDLEVSYIAPAPTWRVSYRLVVEAAQEEQPEALLQGWGIFDNRLEEDLTDISLSLTAGMPISFVYDLYTPHTPERPEVKDEERVAAGPVMFKGAMAEAYLEEAEEGLLRSAAPMAQPAPDKMRRRVSAKAMADSVESAATGQALGELFQYNVGVPVTVGRGQSAMVPIVSSKLSPRKDLIYNEAKMPAHPVATLRFDNSTGLTLERGPVTVLENGEYVGEAVLPFSADQAEVVVSYAVELGLHIKRTVKSESQLHSLAIKDNFLVQNYYDIKRTTYQVENRTPQNKAVLLEHPLDSRFTVFDTPEPAEKTLDSHRYRVEVSSAKVTEFTVQERWLRVNRQQLLNLAYRDLQRYFKDNFLDEQTYVQLKTLLDTLAQIEQLKKKISKQEQRRQKIYQTQEQAQKNMAVLSNEGEEGRLRGRYVKQLTQSEEELADIDRKVAGLETEIDQKEAQVKQVIANLQ